MKPNYENDDNELNHVIHGVTNQLNISSNVATASAKNTSAAGTGNKVYMNMKEGLKGKQPFKGGGGGGNNNINTNQQQRRFMNNQKNNVKYDDGEDYSESSGSDSDSDDSSTDGGDRGGAGGKGNYSNNSKGNESAEDYSDDEDEGEDGYKEGGYHRVKVGEVYNQR